MAYPFGQSPTLKEYIGWCNQQGCTTRSGVKNTINRLIQLHTLESKAGRHVVIPMDMTERLIPRMVAYLDRRLGLDLPFPKIGDGADLPEGH